MSKLIEALTDPKVWVAVLLTMIVPRLYEFLLNKVKSANRGLRAAKLRKIKRHRFNQDFVVYYSVRSGVFFLLFMGTIVSYVALLTMGPLRSIAKLPFWFQLMVFSPVFITEILWLNNRVFILDLIKYRKKLKQIVIMRI